GVWVVGGGVEGVGGAWGVGWEREDGGGGEGRAEVRVERKLAGSALSRFGIRAANQGCVPPVLRMRSTGLAQVAGGAGDRTSSMWKSPLGASATPEVGVLCSTKGAAASQISVAKTF